jgi:hypothetical protein
VVFLGTPTVSSFRTNSCSLFLFLPDTIVIVLFVIYVKILSKATSMSMREIQVGYTKKGTVLWGFYQLNGESPEHTKDNILQNSPQHCMTIDEFMMCHMNVHYQ